jgi:hypothetical protein
MHPGIASTATAERDNADPGGGYHEGSPRVRGGLQQEKGRVTGDGGRPWL